MQVALPFPIKGIDRRLAYANQPKLTTPDALNVIPLDVSNGRQRGGQRPGLAKWTQWNYSELAGSQSVYPVTLRETYYLSGDLEAAFEGVEYLAARASGAFMYALSDSPFAADPGHPSEIYTTPHASEYLRGAFTFNPTGTAGYRNLRVVATSAQGTIIFRVDVVEDVLTISIDTMDGGGQAGLSNWAPRRRSPSRHGRSGWN